LERGHVSRSAVRRTEEEPISPWSPPVLTLLKDWRIRADAAALTHFRTAARLSSLNAALGIPVVILTTVAGTSIFATLQERESLALKIFVGLVIVGAAILASLQAFFKFPERAERHRIAGNRWAAFRREVDKMTSLHPDYKEARGDPKRYLDALQERMDNLASEAPEMSVRLWKRAGAHYGFAHGMTENGVPIEDASEDPIASRVDTSQ
jgi:hypothetical protein